MPYILSTSRVGIPPGTQFRPSFLLTLATARVTMPGPPCCCEVGGRPTPGFAARPSRANFKRRTSAFACSASAFAAANASSLGEEAHAPINQNYFSRGVSLSTHMFGSSPQLAYHRCLEQGAFHFCLYYLDRACTHITYIVLTKTASPSASPPSASKTAASRSAPCPYRRCSQTHCRAGRAPCTPG